MKKQKKIDNNNKIEEKNYDQIETKTITKLKTTITKLK
jgi:hypothetical protein